MSEVLRVGVTRDLRGADGRPVHDLGLDRLTADPAVTWDWLPVQEPELQPATVAGFDALMVWEPGAITAATLAGAPRLRLVARFGMGLDAIDLDACARHGVAVTTSPYAVREVIPAAAMSYVLALAHRLGDKDRLVRTGRWDDRFEVVARGTAGSTLGVIGFGNVGRGIARLAGPFGFRRLVADPHADPGTVPAGVALVELDELLAEADFVCVACPLTPDTEHLLDRDRLGRMRLGAYLVNVSRGPIVDTLALAEALERGHLAGAALDVFETEPPEPDHPLLARDDVLLSPHAIGYTDAAFRGLGADACASVLAVAHGERPEHLVDPAVLPEAPRGR